MSKQYLYGAAVQGIQSFIFSTNDLKSIVGASELVESICTTMFDEFATEGESIIRAAGNIKHLFDTEQACRRAVLEFPKKVMSQAEGITLSQAVVEVVDGKFESAVDELEKKLRIQRNKPIRPLSLGLNGIKRSPQTGLPAVKSVDGKLVDLGSYQKLLCTAQANEGIAQKMFGENLCEKVTFNISKLSGENSWLAVIHADGNGLGQIVATIGKERALFSRFSKCLDEATKAAARKAYEALELNEKIIPIRPIVLGGDDFTVVCRADVAIPLVTNFLRFFEQETHKRMASDILTPKNGFKFDRLTACAGIAYIKDSYPFYYGYHLAESLCEAAKSDAKSDDRKVNGLAPSCLMFHKVQDSFVESYKEIGKRELTPYDGHSFMYGPYYCDPIAERCTIAELMAMAKRLDVSSESKDGNAVKSHLRQWLSLMHNNPETAVQKTERLLSMLNGKDFYNLAKELTSGTIRKQQGEEVRCYAVYDVLAVVSLHKKTAKK